MVMYCAHLNAHPVHENLRNHSVHIVPLYVCAACISCLCTFLLACSHETLLVKHLIRSQGERQAWMVYAHQLTITN
jgi:hypothetical protein